MTRGGDAIYRYDANGNRIAKEDAGLYRYHTEHPDVSYQYDYEDRLIRIVEQQLHPANRTADTDDLPAEITRKPALQFVTEYRYDGLEVLYEHSSRQDHQAKTFYRAGGALVGQFRYSTSYNFSDVQIPRMYLDYYSHDGLDGVTTISMPVKRDA
jgi:YD repeat-containing protein